MEYYSSDNISKQKANINLILGERSCGKSYDIKIKKGIKHYLDTNMRFILVRRKREEISNVDVELYFSDLDIKEMTNDEYDSIVCNKKTIYLGRYDAETGKTKGIEKIGYFRSLSTEQNTAGQQYPDVDMIIFEEFMSRDVYLRNEPDKLMNFYCTVDRKRGKTQMWLLGNTITRVCPYLKDWDLMSVVKKQKQGEIRTFEREAGTDEDGNIIKVKIAVELCAPSGRSSFTIGQNKEMMNTGKWQTSIQPLLPKSYKEYKVIYRIVLKYKGFKFLAEFLEDKTTHDICWFIRPKSTPIKKNTIVITDEINISPFYQRNIYDLTIKNDKIKDIMKLFREQNIFYANDLTGTDFKQAIDFEIRR